MKKTELIKERNEIAKTLYTANGGKSSALSAVSKADSLMSEMYGKNWFMAGDGESDESSRQNECYGISLYVDEKGGKWVRVNVYGYDFMLDIYDMKDGEKDEFTFDEAIEFAKSQGCEIPSKDQWHIVGAYKKEIARVIEEAGGDQLKGWLWSKTEYSSSFGWIFGGTYGYLHTLSKCYTNGSRRLAYPKSNS